VSPTPIGVSPQCGDTPHNVGTPPIGSELHPLKLQERVGG